MSNSESRKNVEWPGLKIESAVSELQSCFVLNSRLGISWLVVDFRVVVAGTAVLLGIRFAATTPSATRMYARF